jgi:tetratricopeptide (TPR) repeat protein
MRGAAPRKAGRFLLGAALCLALAACQSSEEKAAAFFQSGLELREAGDLDRAIVEFRNVFRYDGAHREARRNLAEVFQERGDVARAYRQYLRLTEEYPDDATFRARAALIAIEVGNWEEANRHGPRAVAAAPEALGSRIVSLALEYRAAVEAGDAARRAELGRAAEALLAEAPENVTLWQIVVTEAGPDAPDRALAGVDTLIALRPQDLQYWRSKLQLLTETAALDAARAHLEEMQAAFPKSEDVTRMTVGWHLLQDDAAAAIAALRRDAGAETGNPRNHAPVIALIRQLDGPEAALDEISRLIEANAEVPANRAHYRGLRATERLRAGDVEAAIAELQDVIATTELPGRLLWIKSTLADALRVQGRDAEALALVEEVLAEDATNTEALKVRGALLVAQDRPGEAIVDLRRALDQDPRDADILVLLAEAHQREGNPELMGERLAAAVEVSEAGVPETLRYAAFLLSQGRSGAVRTLLAESRANNPGDVGLLAQIGRFSLQQRDAGAVEGVIAELRGLDPEAAPEAARVAQALQTGLLLLQSRDEEGIDLLMRQAGEMGEDARAVLAVVNAWIQSGRVDQARAYLDDLRSRAPDDLELRLVDGALAIVEGDPERSETLMRALVEEAPESPQALEATRLLYGRLLQQGRTDEIGPLLEAMLAVQPEDRLLLLLRATYLESRDDMDGAIAIYEELYARNTADVLVANNLASLISAHRTEDAALERAARIAQRLRGTSVPAFQDTYGWIAHRRGRYEEALTYLEPAARSLSSDPLVQYHLGMTYHALERPDEARAALERAVSLGASRDLPQMGRARAVLDTLAALDAGEALDAAPAMRPTGIDETSAAPGGNVATPGETLPTGNNSGD